MEEIKKNFTAAAPPAWAQTTIQEQKITPWKVSLDSSLAEDPTSVPYLPADAPEPKTPADLDNNSMIKIIGLDNKVQAVPFSEAVNLWKAGSARFLPKTVVGLIDPNDGKSVGLDEQHLSEALAQGYQFETPSQKDLRLHLENSEGWKAAAEVGAKQFLNQATFGVTGEIEDQTSSPLERSYIDAIKEQHPIANYAAGAAGFGASLLYGGEIAKAGKLAEEAVVGAKALSAAEKVIVAGTEAAITKSAPTFARTIAGSAAKGAVEGALFSAPVAATKAYFGDYKEAAESLVIGGLAGGALGAIFPVLGKGAKAAGEGFSYVSKTIGEHVAGDTKAVIDELHRLTERGSLGEYGVQRIDAAMSHLADPNVIGKGWTKTDKLEALYAKSLEGVSEVLEEIDGNQAASALPQPKFKMSEAISALGGTANISGISGDVFKDIVSTKNINEWLVSGQKIPLQYPEITFKEAQMKSLELLGDAFDNISTGSSKTRSNAWKKFEFASSFAEELDRQVQANKDNIAPELIQKYIDNSKSINAAGAIAALQEGAKIPLSATDKKIIQTYAASKTVDVGQMMEFGKHAGGLGLAGVSLLTGHPVVGLASLGFGAVRAIINAKADNIAMNAIKQKTFPIVEKITGSIAKRLDKIPEILSSKTIAPIKTANAFARFLGHTSGNKDNDYSAVVNRIEQYQQNKQVSKERIARNAELLTGFDKNLHFAYSQQLQNTFDYIANQLPIQSNVANLKDSVSKKVKGGNINDANVNKMHRIMEVIDNPLSVVSRLMDNTLTRGEVDTLKAVYPQIHKKMVNKIMTEINTGKVQLPFGTRVKLGMLLDLPLDESIGKVAQYQQSFASEQAAEAKSKIEVPDIQTQSQKLSAKMA